MKPEIRVTMRKPEVRKALGVSNTTLEDLVSLGLLDPPFRLTPGGRTVGWDAEAVAKYQAKQRSETVIYKTNSPRLEPMRRSAATSAPKAKRAETAPAAQKPRKTPPPDTATAPRPTVKERLLAKAKERA